MTAYDSYQEIEILTADPMKLIALLYRGALDSVRAAREHLRAGEIAERGRAVSKAAAILVELASSLDHDRGGDLSRRLAALYDYMQSRLNEGNFTQADAPFADVENVLSELLEGWVGCSVPEREIENREELEPVSCLC
jgi:flagellar secretion chaperone FliS